jgi:hypothetical protein
LGAVKMGKAHCKQIQIIGDCEILTKAMNDGTRVDDPYLNEILNEIRSEAAHYENISFHHVSRKHNKRADALATAASISAAAGKRATQDREWDPRENNEYTQDRMDLVHKSKRFKDLRSYRIVDEGFPVVSSSRPDNRSVRTIQEEWRTFPAQKGPKGGFMGKVRMSYNMRTFTETNPERPTIEGCEWERHRGFKEMSQALMIKSKNVSINTKNQGLRRGDPNTRRAIPEGIKKKMHRNATPKSKHQSEWIGNAPANSRRKFDSVQVVTSGTPLPRISHLPIECRWNLSPGSNINIARRKERVSTLTGNSPPMDDTRWEMWRAMAKAQEAEKKPPPIPSSAKKPFLSNTPSRVRDLWERGRNTQGIREASPESGPQPSEHNEPTEDISEELNRQDEINLSTNGLSRLSDSPPSPAEDGDTLGSDDSLDELWNELQSPPRTERSSTPPIIIELAPPPPPPTERWMEQCNWKQANLHRFIEFPGKKAFEARRVASRRIGRSAKPQSRKKEEVSKEKGKESSGKGKDKKNKGIMKWFQPIPKEQEQTQGSRRTGSEGLDEVRRTSNGVSQG